MSFILANFLGNSPGISEQVEDKQLIIEKLTTKMVNSAYLEDRKAAAQTIKSLARSYRFEIGTLALQALIDELRRDLEDDELAKIILETLDILCSSKEGEEGIEVQFCEILLKNDQNITLLLDLMGNSDDFYLKFTSIQILMSLCNSQPFQLQSAVLNSPSGVEKVLNLLKDPREILRNEGLLFCGSLVRGSTDLQKIFAFQGAFEHVTKIIVEDENGPWDGQIIVQDSFNLIFELLNLNTANQTYFRDSICFKQLAGLLAFPTSGEDDLLWNRTRISNYLAALSLLDGILCKSNVDLEASQYAAMRTHFFSPLVQLAFNPKVPQEVSASALNCLSGMIWSNNRAQQEFSKERLNFALGIKRIEPPISTLMAAICLAINGNPTAGNVSEEAAFNQRIKALELVESFCIGNYDGQLVLLSTLKSTSDSSVSPGSMILEALFDLDSSRKKDPWHCWFASFLLCHMINGNEEAKKMLLKHVLIDSDGEEDEDILTALMLNLIRIARDSRGATHQKSITGYLQLILVWFHESPLSIKHFLLEGSYIQYLIERITQQSHHQDIQIQGISALILGICVLYNDESVQSFGSEALKSVIKNRIGPDLFISKLSRLKAEKNDLSNVILMKNYDNIVKLVARPTPAGTKASHTATLAQLSKDLTECRALLTDTQSHLAQSETLNTTLKVGISERDTYILQIQKIISAKNQKIAQMAHEMSNLEQQQQQQQTPNEYYEQYLSDQAALKNLNETIKSFQETVKRQQARIEELEALLNAGTNGNGNNGADETELKKWKEAYDKLNDQVKQQLNLSGEYEFNCENNAMNESFEPNAVVVSNETSSAQDFEPSQTIQFDHLSNETEVKDIILSPSMFMSPLVEDSSVSVISEDSGVVVESTIKYSPELISLNQLPEVEKLNEYPELKEAAGTNFNAAVIISEEYALNAPNQTKDEQIIQNISAECPPDNFLDSDTDDSVEIVSQEEIKNVLGFFDNLPNLTQQEDEVKSIQEELVNLDVKGDHVEPFIETDITESFDLSGDQSFDYFGQESSNSNDEISASENNHESSLLDAAAVDSSNHQSELEYPQKSQIVEDPSTQSAPQEYPVYSTSEYSQEYSNPTEDNSNASEQFPQDNSNSENVQHSLYPSKNDYTQDYTANASENYSALQEGQESSEYSNQEINYEYNQAYNNEYPEEYNGEYNQGYSNEYSQEYADQFNQVYIAEEQYQDQQVYLDQTNPDYSTEGQSQDQQVYLDQSNQVYTTDGQSQDQDQQECVNQDYYTDDQSQFTYEQTHEQDQLESSYNHYQEQNSQLNNLEQDQQVYEQISEQVYDQSNEQGYDQSSEQVYDQSNEQVYDQSNEQGYDQSNEQVYDQNYEQASQVYEQDPLAIEQEQQTNEQIYEQDANGHIQEQEPQNEQAQYAYDQYYEEANGQSYEQDPQADGQIYEQDTQADGQIYEQDTQVNGQIYEQDTQVNDQMYEQDPQDYNQYYQQSFQNGTQDYNESYDQVRNSEVYNDQTTNEYSQEHQTDQYSAEIPTDQQQQDQQQQSSEYYYYDEATGFTYGFDQNVNQYYYYDPNTGQYTYYTAESETVEAASESNNYAETAAQSTCSESSNSVESNPSLFELSGPPMISLQHHQQSSLSTNNFVADQVYNL